MTEHKFTDAKAARNFILSGNAYLTLRSLKTQTRYTFRVKKAADRNVFWVSTLYGPSNTKDYAYVGMIAEGVYKPYTARGRERSPQSLGFEWAWAKLQLGEIPADLLEVWHEGRCGVCGRKLTNPDSIAAGIGPECAIKEEHKSHRPGKIVY